MKQAYKAVILDMDGVITRTAGLHARAWEQLFNEYLSFRKRQNKFLFEPIQIAQDDPLYFKGVPRLEGIQNFLDSREIELPQGTPSDNMEEETIHGLAKRKNEIFQQLLKTEKVTPIASTVQKIREWKEKGIKVAVISSSKNALAILQAAGLEDLFEVRVDGIISEEKNIKGKPQPDIFLEAARRLEVSPERSIMVEDSLAGVKAGHDGNFALVVGIDQEMRMSYEFEKRGADIVLPDLKELNDLTIEQYFRRKPATLPSSLDMSSPFEMAQDKQPLFFFDYDGTLTPIVNDPEKAFLDPEIKTLLQELKKRFPVAVISGRGLKDIEELLKLPGIWVSGSHGFELRNPQGKVHEAEEGRQALPELKQAHLFLNEAFSNIKGTKVERKKFALAIHYRNCHKQDLPKVKQLVREAWKNTHQLTLDQGKKIFELKPDVNWNKGKALHWMMEKMGFSPSTSYPIYLGDDLTDETAFKAIRESGCGILVGDHGHLTAAHYQLEGVDAVQTWLKQLASSFIKTGP